MTRTIRLEQAKLMKAVDESGKPLVEEPQPEQQQILVQPNITFNPEIKIPPIEIPQPAITVEAPVVTVEAPDMTPIAEAITNIEKSIAETVPVIQVAAPDFEPVARAIDNMAEAISQKEIINNDIKDLLQQIANRPQGARWKFTITRDARGDIESMDAVKEPA